MKLFEYMAVCILIGNMAYAEGTDLTFTLWQLPAQTTSQMNSYVLRTPGNELVVIDGGMQGDASYLRKFIRDRGNHVQAWFISHAHLDHVGALIEILNSLGDMKIDRIYGSLPDDEWLKELQSANLLIAGEPVTQRTLLAGAAASNHEVLDLALGQKIKFQDVIFEILGVRNPELTGNAINNQSAVWRVNIGEKSILFLGDLGVQGGKKLLASPYRSRLKADYVQMAHHGQAGVNEEFYKAVNPTFCLWPTPDWLWDNKKGTGPYKTLEVRAWMDKLNIEKHYVAKDGLHRIDIPIHRKNRTAEQSPAGDSLKVSSD